MDYQKLYQKAASLQHANSEVYKKYKAIQVYYSEIVQNLVAYINENHLVPEKIVEKMGCKVFQMDLDNHVDSSVYGDLMMYPSVMDEECVIEKYMQTHDLPDYSKDLLESMKNSYISIFLVKERIEKDAKVVLEDVINRQEITIVDEYLGQHSTSDYLLLRIIEYTNISFQSGLVINLENNAESKRLIRKNKTLFTRTYKGKGLIEIFNYYKTQLIKKGNR